METITGLRPSLAGRIVLDGIDITDHSLVRSIEVEWRMSRGSSGERGLVLEFTVAENMVLDAYYDQPYSRGIRMDWDGGHRASQRLVDEYDVRTTRVDVLVSNLSGGNQQGDRCSRIRPRRALIIASQPTRGVDVGSIEYIHAQIVEQRDQGAAVFIVSSGSTRSWRCPTGFW